MTGRKQKPVEQVAKKFAKALVATAKTQDPAFQRRREQREAAVSRALAEHLAKRKK